MDSRDAGESYFCLRQRPRPGRRRVWTVFCAFKELQSGGGGGGCDGVVVVVVVLSQRREKKNRIVPLPPPSVKRVAFSRYCKLAIKALLSSYEAPALESLSVCV